MTKQEQRIMAVAKQVANSQVAKMYRGMYQTHEERLSDVSLCVTTLLNREKDIDVMSDDFHKQLYQEVKYYRQNEKQRIMAEKRQANLNSLELDKEIIDGITLNATIKNENEDLDYNVRLNELVNKYIKQDEIVKTVVKFGGMRGKNLGKICEELGISRYKLNQYMKDLRDLLEKVEGMVRYENKKHTKKAATS